MVRHLGTGPFEDGIEVVDQLGVGLAPGGAGREHDAFDQRPARR